MVRLARRYGLSPVAQALKVNYNGLQEHLAASPHLPASEPRGESARFVEVPVAALSGAPQWVLELEDRRGSRLTLRLGPGDGVAALALAQGLWRTRA